MSFTCIFIAPNLFPGPILLLFPLRQLSYSLIITKTYYSPISIHPSTVRLQRRNKIRSESGSNWRNLRPRNPLLRTKNHHVPPTRGRSQKLRQGNLRPPRNLPARKTRRLSIIHQIQPQYFVKQQHLRGRCYPTHASFITLQSCY